MLDGRSWITPIFRPASIWTTVFVAFTLGCNAATSPSGTGSPITESRQSQALSPEAALRVEAFCAACHALPLAETFPKSRWEEEVEQGFGFYIASGRADLIEPTRSEAVRYFRDRAPERIEIPVWPSVPTDVLFEKSLPVSSVGKLAASVSDLRWNTDNQTLLVSDMRSGEVSHYSPADNWRRSVVGHVKNCCRVTPCDWNNDGNRDYLVADIGSFAVADHASGRIELWLGSADGSHKSIELVRDLGRVVEAQLIDYDEDGDQDILVAEFGWRTSGALKLLRNPGGDESEKRMQVEQLDSRHGVLGVRVADLDRDGNLDYVVAYGQEYETLEIHYHRSSGLYERTVVLTMPDPSYNSSSFELADIDGDGRLDIVHTNGDTMDAFLPKPYHGVRWLQNLEDRKWRAHELGLLVGALDSCVADFDGDGDMDIAAVGMLAHSDQSAAETFDSIVWWEQDRDLVFKRHALEHYGPSHAVCTAGDVNGDGLPDLIVGQWSPNPDSAPLEIFMSRRSAGP